MISRPREMVFGPREIISRPRKLLREGGFVRVMFVVWGREGGLGPDKRGGRGRRSRHRRDAPLPAPRDWVGVEDTTLESGATKARGTRGHTVIAYGPFPSAQCLMPSAYAPVKPWSLWALGSVRWMMSLTPC